METLRESGTIKKLQKGGYFYLPKSVQKELGVWESHKDEVPFVTDANVVLLLRKGTKLQDILKGLDVLKEDLKLRWKEEAEK